MIHVRSLPCAALAVASLALAAPVGAAVLFSDSFSSPDGTLLSSSSGWAQGTTTTSGDPLQIQDGALSLQSPASGSSERDVHSLGATIASGTIYFGLDITVTDAPGSTPINLVFLTGDPAAAGNGTGAYLNVITDSSGFRFGVCVLNGTSAATATYGSEVLALNTTYRVVIGYTFVDGALNNTASLFVNGALIGSDAYLGTDNAEPASFTYLGIRQPTLNNAAGFVVDDLVAATTFAEAATFPSSAVPEPASAAALLGAGAFTLVAAGRRRPRVV